MDCDKESIKGYPKIKNIVNEMRGIVLPMKKTPDITRIIPIDAENGAETFDEFGTSSLIIIPNFATTKPSAITDIQILNVNRQNS